MKLFFLTLLSVFSFSSFAQLNDNFTDGDFTTNPTWSGDDSVFTVVSNQLRSNKVMTNSTFYLSTANTTATNCQWEFLVNLKFATSSTNYVDVYLSSDQSNLKSTTINGYFVRIGNTNDDVSLYKKTAGAGLILIDGLNGLISSSSNNIVKIKVTRDNANVFTLFDDFGSTGTYAS